MTRDRDVREERLSSNLAGPNALGRAATALVGGNERSAPSATADLDQIKVGFITGSPDVGRCGIHDYAATLALAMQRVKVSSELIDQRVWSLRGLRALQQAIERSGVDIVHLQYPMIVGWRSLGPHALGLLSRKPLVVTLHEFTSFDRVRRASMGAFALLAKRIVMTTDFERDHFLQAFPRAAGKVETIAIGSNIPYRDRPTDSDGSMARIIYFGQIKPGKGLEEFVNLVRYASKAQRSWIFQIVGAPVGWAPSYLDGLRQAVAGLPVEWVLNPSDEEAALQLAQADVAYLPYPDGISERRGSFIAALGNGVPVVTTDGPARPRNVDSVALLVANPEEADAAIESLIHNPTLREKLRSAGRAYAAKHDWGRIARQYRTVYEALRERGTDRPLTENRSA